MDERIRRVLADYEERFDREEALIPGLPREEFMAQRDGFLLAVGPGIGELLNVLVRELRPRVVLEVGTSYGYSTIWLAEAVRKVGARLVSMEIAPEKVEFARARLADAGLAGQVEFMVGDARDAIRQLDTDVDFVLMDLWKEFYWPCFELLMPKLPPGALVVADNMLSPPHFVEDAKRYREAVAATGEFDTVLLPAGDGLALSIRRA